MPKCIKWQQFYSRFGSGIYIYITQLKATK